MDLLVWLYLFSDFGIEYGLPDFVTKALGGVIITFSFISLILRKKYSRLSLVFGFILLFKSVFLLIDFRQDLVNLYIIEVMLVLVLMYAIEHGKGGLIMGRLNIPLLIIYSGVEFIETITNPVEREIGLVINGSNGYVYSIVALAFLTLSRRKVSSHWVLAVSFLMTLVTAKRGALLWYIVELIRGLKIRDLIRLRILILVALIAFIGLNLSSNLLLRMNDFNNVETAGSGRLILMTSIFSSISSNPIQGIIGHGYFAEWNLLNNMSHNELVRNVYCFGVFGLIFYSVKYRVMLRVSERNGLLRGIVLFEFIRGLSSDIVRTDMILFYLVLGILINERFTTN